MKNIEKLKQEYQNLQEKILKIKKEYGFNDGFSEEKQLDNFIKNNKNILEESNKLREQIQKLEYELMTPEEQKRYDKGMEFLRLKAKGEPFDFTQFDDLNG